jgi:hypothetical protein
VFSVGNAGFVDFKKEGTMTAGKKLAGHLRQQLERRHAGNARFLGLLASLTEELLIAAHDRHHKAEVAYLAAQNAKPAVVQEVQQTVELLVTREMRERHVRRKARHGAKNRESFSVVGYP